MRPVSGIIMLAVSLSRAATVSASASASASASMKSAELKEFNLNEGARMQYEGHHPHKATCTCHFNDSGYLVDSHYKLY